ncbi:MAG: AMP-binding protein, partial [bacterium]|nr:AMP-binding protein [bacterium]
MKKKLEPVHLDRDSLTVGQPVKESEPGPGTVSFVQLGPPLEGCSYRITSKEGKPLADNTIGHIAVKGASVTSGYYHNRAATDAVLSPDGWLDTGDIGFVRNNRLVVTGRAKDIIFVNGQNYYPHDIETIAEGVAGIELGNVVAVGAFNEKNSVEEIVVFVRFKRDIKAFAPLARQLKKHINRHIGLNIKQVLPVQRIPKTTSGKYKRYKLAEMYLAGHFDTIIHELTGELTISPIKRESRLSDTETRLLQTWQNQLECPSLKVEDHFLEAGGNSITLVRTVAEIRETFGIPLGY